MQTNKTTEEQLREALTDIIAGLGSCICHKGFTSRQLTDPDCVYCGNKFEIDNGLTALALPVTPVRREYRLVMEQRYADGKWLPKVIDMGYSLKDAMESCSSMSAAKTKFRLTHIEFRDVAEPSEWRPMEEK